MVRLRGSTCALGLDAICFGSMTAWGVGKVWAAAVSATTVLMSMTIANGMKVRMESSGPRVSRTESLTEGRRSLCPVISTFHLDRMTSLYSDVPRTGAYAFAFLCISTVLQVLSAAWQRFSRGQSTHLGLRAMQRLRPCQMIWWEKRIHFSRGITFIKSSSIFGGRSEEHTSEL